MKIKAFWGRNIIWTALDMMDSDLDRVQDEKDLNAMVMLNYALADTISKMIKALQI